MKIIGVDPSLTATGLAAREYLETFMPKTKGVQRLIAIRDAVVNLARSWDPVIVMIEGYSYKSGNQAHQAGELGGVLRVALHEAGILYVVVAPAQLKAYACGKGNADKFDVLSEAVRRLGYAGHSPDQADALWLYAIGCDWLGEPICEMPQKNRTVLQKITWPEFAR